MLEARRRQEREGEPSVWMAPLRVRVFWQRSAARGRLRLAVACAGRALLLAARRGCRFVSLLSALAVSAAPNKKRLPRQALVANGDPGGIRTPDPLIRSQIL